MKFKQLLAVAIVAALVGHFTPGVDLTGRVPTGLPFDRLVPSAFAQQVGYGLQNNIHMVYLNADFTDANAAGLQNIPRLSWYLPALQGVPFKIECTLHYSQATAANDTFGIQFSNSPTTAQMGGIVATNATAFASGTPATITNTSATAVAAFTPAVTTVLYGHLSGFVEQASNATDTLVNMSVSQSTAANVVVIKRGSACIYHSMN